MLSNQKQKNYGKATLRLVPLAFFRVVVVVTTGVGIYIYIYFLTYFHIAKLLYDWRSRVLSYPNIKLSPHEQVFCYILWRA